MNSDPKEWVNNVYYKQGDVVCHNGRFYKARIDTLMTTHEPKQSNYWEEITPVPVQVKVWKEGKAYKKGERVYYKGCQYVAKRNLASAITYPDDSNIWSYIEPEWKMTPKTNTVEREILTEICIDALESLSNDYETEWMVKLEAWWEANRPKTDREIKLEKIQSIICQNKTFTVEQQAEEILKLLGE